MERRRNERKNNRARVAKPGLEPGSSAFRATVLTTKLLGPHASDTSILSVKEIRKEIYIRVYAVCDL